MNELVNNPMKMGNLLALSQSQPRLAQKAIQDLSKSISTNQAAIAEDSQARDPLSQIKPSKNAGMDDGAMTVGDFRKLFKG